MGISKTGDVQYRSEFSRCQKCEWYIKDYKCWSHDYIPYYTWENFDDPKESNCAYFKSNISNQCNSHYVHRDYTDEDLFPEKKFGGKYRFDSKGNRI